MTKIYGGVVVMAAVMAILVSSAQAAMEIHVVAEVESGLAFIKGKGAARGAPITWEGGFVTTANHGNGSFSFFGELPGDCTGVLSDGNETISITVFDCTVVTAALAPAPAAKTGQTVVSLPGTMALFKRVWPGRIRDSPTTTTGRSRTI